MRRLLPLVTILLLAACARRPSFTAEAMPGTRVDVFHTAAFDPRALAWLVEGQRPMQAENLKPLVRSALEHHGYQWTEPEAADLWVDVVALRPERSGGGRGSGPSGREGRGRGPFGGGRPGGEGPVFGTGREPDSPFQEAIEFQDLDSKQDLTIKVQILKRTSLEMLWTGTVHRPGQKKPDTAQSEATLPQLVEQLLAPIPARRA